MRVSPIIYADRPVGLRGIFVNISDRKQIEQVKREGLIQTIKKLQMARKTVLPEPTLDKLRRTQIEAIDTIKKHLEVGRPSPVVEAYKELLAKPLEGTKARKKQRRKKT